MNTVIYLDQYGAEEENHEFTYTGEGAYEFILTDGSFGLGVYQRGIADNHLCFRILTEDDGALFESNLGWSSFWLKPLMKFLEKCEDHLHLRYEDDLHNEIPVGYIFEELAK